MNTQLALRSVGHEEAELASMAEHIESRAWTDIVDAAPLWLRRATGLAVEDIGGALMIAGHYLDNLLFNRVIGLGERAPASDEQIAGLMERYWSLGVPKYWVHVGPYARPARLGRLLQEHGLAPYRRSWVKMMRPARRAAAVETEVRVREARVEDVAAIASIVGPAFDLPQRAAELLTNLIGRRHWQLFVAELQSEIIGAAGLFTEGEIAYLPFAATRPAFRRLGAQRAMMQARIDLAVDAGCRWIATETGFPLAADEENPSYQNMLWAGFRPVAIRDNYAPAGTRWGEPAL